MATRRPFTGCRCSPTVFRGSRPTPAISRPGYAEDAYPFRSFHEHLHRCFDAFGPDRMFWGTGITRMPCS